MFAHCRGIYFRCLDEFGDPVVYPAQLDCLQQVGMDREDALFPNDYRIFEGFDFLREFFVFPRKFLGCNLTGLADVLPRIKSQDASIFCLPSTRSTRDLPQRCSRRCSRSMRHPRSICSRRLPIAFHSSPASMNIMSCRIAADYLDYEPFRILDVYAHFSGGRNKVPVHPLYSASIEGDEQGSGPFYTRCEDFRGGAPWRKSAAACRRTIPAPTCSSR